MAHNDIEIELKFPLNNPDDVVNHLNTLTQRSKKVFQKDTYFSPVHRDFLSPEFPFEWLRIRETDKGFSVNYKHFYPPNTKETHYCDEFETSINSAELIKKIFSKLDFKELVVVEKERSTWEIEGVEIAIDLVKDHGAFIELELMKHFEDPIEGRTYLYDLLKKLNANTGVEDLRGYPYLILEKQGYKFKKEKN
jgi:adenylate cyclase, class 2